MMYSAAVVLIEFIDLDLLGTRIIVIRGKDGRRGTSIVHKADREQGGRAGARRKIHTVEIRERLKDPFHLVPMRFAELGNL